MYMYIYNYLLRSMLNHLCIIRNDVKSLQDIPRVSSMNLRYLKNI